VEAIACSVAIGEQKLSSFRLIDVVGPVQNFEEQMGKLNRMIWRAHSAVDIRKIGHVS
jgi:hypothetical protein